MKILCVFGQHAYGDPARGIGYEYANFLPALHRLGHEMQFFESFSRSGHADFAALNRALVAAVNEQRPDAILFVLTGYEIWTETLDLLRAHSSAALLNWSTDDSWKYEQFSRFVARHFDLYVTTDAAALAKASRDGLGNVVLSQWAASGERLAEPLPASECSHTVSFVGAAYGNRPRWIAALRRRGIEVACFGHGWRHGAVTSDEVARIFRESVISLNFADSPRLLLPIEWLGSPGRALGPSPGYSRQIKARVLEVPGAGGFLLTQTADHLDAFLAPGTEIAIFDDVDDLARKIRHFLAQPDERDAYARAGHARTRLEHTYEARFAVLLPEALRRAAPRAAQPWSLDSAEARNQLDELARRYATGPALRVARALLVAPMRLIWGPRRGARAARRLLYEASWRLTGAATYSAAGWPGRLFYAES